MCRAQARKTSVVSVRAVLEVLKAAVAHQRRRAGSMAEARDGLRKAPGHRHRLVVQDKLSRLRVAPRRISGTRKARQTARSIRRMAPPRRSKEGSRGIGSKSRMQSSLSVLTVSHPCAILRLRLKLLCLIFFSRLFGYSTSVFLSLLTSPLSFISVYSHLVRLSSITLCKIKSLCDLGQSIWASLYQHRQLLRVRCIHPSAEEGNNGKT